MCSSLKFLLPLALAGAQLFGQSPFDALESILFPLGYGSHCWSAVTVQNLSDVDAEIWLTAHAPNGAIVPFTGVSSNHFRLRARTKSSMRLQIPDEEARTAWVHLKEDRGDGSTPPSISMRGATECSDSSKLAITPAHVIYLARDPWIRGDVDDFHAKEIWILNASESPATAEACYSTGISAQSPTDGEPIEICTQQDAFFLPPFASRTAPLVKGGNSRFSMKSHGASLALQIVMANESKTRKFSVDSSVKFADIPDEVRKAPQ